ncbi:8-oxo-dGTP pyrophosphatase MutT (NUDIX family) [Bradyrhizobium sp. S3.12.5]|uniref:NUDIX hydrolase n=1 Tax=Bradyrhizobium sp. S3.12.5 TaxID=3156386 RepID=UPI0033940215
MRALGDATRRNIAQACATFARLPDAAEPSTLKRAAVVLALMASHDGDDTAFLLTKRASSLRAHRGQWALPGGRCDAGETPVEAALRELDEELALRLPVDAVLGLLDDYPTRSGYLITPVVVWAAESNAITPNPDEVASVHRISLDTIERDDAFDFTDIAESNRRVIRFHHQMSLIHAPTAALIYQFREVLAGRQTRVGDLEQPVFAWK